jgi:hypothetical protein
MVEVSFRECSLIVPVLDVGPWNVNDPYWTSSGIAQAESGVDLFGRKTNRAGIDLSEGVFLGLGLTDNSVIQWRFAP